MSFITQPIAWLTGVPEANLRLLMTIGGAYPIARTYKKMYLDKCDSTLISTTTVNERNMFILLAGLSLSLFFNGTYIYHSLLTVAVSYGILYLGDRQGNRFLGTAGVWAFNSIYLLAGYYFTQTDDYDVTWTMPQCILCLRLMGFSFDFLDGEKIPVKVAGPVSEEKADDPAANQATIRPTEEKKAPNQLPLSFSNDTPLPELPDFVQVLAYCFFPSAFLVGPQFSFSLYRKWLATNPKLINTTAEQQEEADNAQMRYVFRSLGLAIVYLALQQGVGSQYPTSYLLTDEYASLSFFRRIWVMMVAGKFVFNKYIGVWLLTEGACAYFGISYEGRNVDGDSLFGGLANTHPSNYETATSIDTVIASFNVNTNLWSKYYVFKRLKFMNNKLISQFGTLGFLAIWHGFHAAYFSTFLTEFIAVMTEQVLRKRLLPLVEPCTQKNFIAFAAWKFVAWASCCCCLYYSVIQFDLLKIGKTLTAYKQVYFLGHLIYAVILSADKFLLRPIIRPLKAKVN